MNIKLKLVGLSAIGLATTAFFYYLKDKYQTVDEKIKQYFEGLLSQIYYQFVDMNQEQIFGDINIKQWSQQLYESAIQFIDTKKLNEELQSITFIQKLNKSNTSLKQLIEIDFVTTYLTKFSLAEIQVNLISKLCSENQIYQQEKYQQSQIQQQFISFIKISFQQIIYLIEQILLEENTNQKSIEILNFLMINLINLLEQLLNENQGLRNLLADVLLSNLDIKLYKFQHDCSDLYLVKSLKTCEENQICNCCIFDLICRYISVFSTLTTDKFFQLLKNHKIIQTQQHWVQIGQIICKNSFYLGGQLSQDSLHYQEELSILHNFLIFCTSNPIIQLQLAQSDEIFINFSYIERVINSHNYSFLNKLLHSLIQNYFIIYPIFYNSESLNLLLRDEQKVKSVLSTFFGVLLNLENKENYDSNQNNQLNIRDWFAMNMGSLLTNQILSNLQVQFILQLLKINHIQNEMLFTYMFCLRSSQNKRIQDRQQKKKFVEINSPITKLISLFIISRLGNDITIKNMDKIINNFGFIDQDERENIFLNILKIQFEMPTMNLNYLKYVAIKCTELSEQAYNSYNGYFANMMNCKTLSYDTYMISIQLAILYGKLDSFLAQLGQGFLRDLQDYKNYKDFLLRDLILLVDIMENPFYIFNVLAQNNQHTQNIQEKLIKQIAIALWQLNPKIQFDLLLSQIGLFIDIPQDYQFIVQLFIFQNKNQIKLKTIYENQWPLMCLQRDFTTIQTYLKLIADDVLFSELLINQNDYDIIDKIQETFFKSPNFIQIIYQLLFSHNRLDIKVWIGKILFYAKKFQNSNTEVNKLLNSKECISFINEMPSNYRQFMLL